VEKLGVAAVDVGPPGAVRAVRELVEADDFMRLGEVVEAGDVFASCDRVS
jgi:hypothetical protein